MQSLDWCRKTAADLKTVTTKQTTSFPPDRQHTVLVQPEEPTLSSGGLNDRVVDVLSMACFGLTAEE